MRLWLTPPCRCRAYGWSTPRRWRPGRWSPPALGEFGAEVIKVEQPGVRGSAAHLGSPARRDGLGLEEREPQQEVRHARPAQCGRAGRCCTSLLDVSDVLRGQHPAEHADAVAAGLRVRARASSATGHAARHRLSGAAVPPATAPDYGTLAEAMSGFAHVTGQPDGPPTLPPFMLADGVACAGGDLRGDDGAVPPRCPRRIGPTRRRQPHRAARSPGRAVDAGLRPARGRRDAHR